MVEPCNIQKLDLKAYGYTLEFAIGDVFGTDFDDTSQLSIDLDDAKRSLQFETNERANANRKNDQKVVSKHTQNIKKLKKNISNLDRDIVEYDKKLDVIENIKELITSTVLNYKSIDLQNIDPQLMLEGMKEYLEDRFHPFGTLHDLDYSTLQGIDTRLKKLFKKQAKKSEDKQLSLVHDTMGDPIVVMMENDQTGLGARFINKTKHYLYNKYSLANKYIDRAKDLQSGLSNFIYINKKWLYNVTPGLQENDALEESLMNTNELVADILDDRTRYLKPTPVYIINEEGTMVLSKEFTDNKLAIIKALNDDLDAGINEGLNIQSIQFENMNRPVFVVSIRQDIVNHDGQEIWYTFEIPAQRIGEKNEYQPEYYPLSAKGKEMSQSSKRWKVWREYFEQTARGMGIAHMDPNDTGATMMEEGFYEAIAHTKRQGQSTKKGKKIKYETAAYYNYTKLDSLPEMLPPEIWSYVTSLRTVLKEFYGEVTLGVTRTTSKINERLDKLVLDGLISEKGRDELLADLMDLDMDSNMFVKDGRLVSPNQYMGEKINYFPHNRTKRDSFHNLLKIENSLFRSIETMNDLLDDSDNIEDHDPEDITTMTEKLEGLEKQYEIIREIILVRTGQKSSYDVANKMQMMDTLNHAKMRTGAVSPLPDPLYQNDGRRGDFQTLVDYFNKMTDKLAKNDLKTDMVDILGRTGPKNRAYLVDHLKATIGRNDSRAAFPMGFTTFEYGEKQVSDAFKKIGFSATPEFIYTILKIPGAIVSGNLLGAGSAQQNSWQQLSEWIEQTVNTEAEIHEIETNTPELRAAIIKESGTMDVMSSIADSLIGSISGDIAWNTGFFVAKDLLLFNLPKQKFLEKIMGEDTYSEWLSAMEVRLGLDVGSLINDKKLIMNDLYEISHGLRKGTLSKKDLKGMHKTTKLMVSKGLANLWVKWGLEGGWASTLIKRAEIRGVMAFTGTEERMRGIAAVSGAVIAVKMGKVPQEWIDAGNSPYLHPEALKYARIMVNKTMFGMSAEFYAKFLRGGTGQTIFKFMPYSYMQMMREGKWILSWWDSMQGKSPAEKKKMIWDTMKLPNKDTKRNAQEERMSRFLYSRVLSSILTVASGLIPALRIVSGITGRWTRGLYKTGVGRGSESMIASWIFRTLHVMQAALNASYYDDDEEDKIYEEWYRFFMPMYLNVTLDFMSSMYKGEYGKGTYKTLGIFSRTTKIIGEQIESWRKNPPELSN